jgi:hypothetical protein
MSLDGVHEHAEASGSGSLSGARNAKAEDEAEVAFIHAYITQGDDELQKVLPTRAAALPRRLRAAQHGSEKDLRPVVV